jgi:high-affinity Fe2+/Pb2+ permease
MSGPTPYLNVVVPALGFAAVLAFVLNLLLHDWVGALHLAIVATFTAITLGLLVHALLIAVIEWIRRNRDDPPGRPEDFDLAA